MNLRESILPFYVALACLSCLHGKPATENDAGARPPAPASEAAAPKPAPSALTYDDKADLPENAGDARCKEAPAAGAKPASVKVEMTSAPGVEIIIPSLGVRQRLWPGAANPNECHTSLVDAGKALRFHCSADESSVDGKIYVRRSDVLIGRANPSGATQTRFVLPCGTPVKLEAVTCPADCKKTADQCACAAARH
jgi:hypothetical protein